VKVGDLVKYGSWYEANVYGSSPVGVILESGKNNMPVRYWFVMWGPENTAWELEDDIEVLNESR